MIKNKKNQKNNMLLKMLFSVYTTADKKGQARPSISCILSFQRYRVQVGDFSQRLYNFCFKSNAIDKLEERLYYLARKIVMSASQLCADSHLGRVSFFSQLPADLDRSERFLHEISFEIAVILPHNQDTLTTSF